MRTGNIDNLALVIEDHRQQRASLVLTDVAYVICARFMLTPRVGESDNEAKHLDIFTRRARKGQCFHQPCLGTREFPAQFELIEQDADLPQAINETRDLGYMLYDIDHDGTRNPMVFRAALDNGVMRVPSPGSPEIRQ
jgi:CRISPR-associated protein Cas5d